MADLEQLVSGPLSAPWKPTNYTGDQLFGNDPKEVEAVQLSVLKTRFEQLMPKLAALRNVAEENRIESLNSLTDIVPLLFPHTMYKSYPMSLITDGRFDLMSMWLDDLTVHDLSALDVSRAETIDEWLDVIEEHTPMRVMTSSGTSGKISLIPKSTHELSQYVSTFAASYSMYRDEDGIDDFGSFERYKVKPHAKCARHNTGRLVQSFVAMHDGNESRIYSEGYKLSTDALWFTSQMKKAEADGTLEQLKRSPGWKRMKERLAQPHPVNLTEEELATKVLRELQGKSILMQGGNDFLWHLVQAAEKHGLEIGFDPSTVIFQTGGKKLDATTPAQRAKIDKMIPFPRPHLYGFGETAHTSRKCKLGHYHGLPWQIPYVLDRDTGESLPRKGVQTGRFAVYDLWAGTYWGGFITGDEVTMNWDGGCACGRRGPYLHEEIARYTEKYGGDDKITCARTGAAVEEMMEHMRSMNAQD